MSERSAVELMLVDRAGGWLNTGRCGSCDVETTLPFGLFVSSRGEPIAIIDLCADCAPNVDRLTTALVGLLPDDAASLLADERKPS